MAVPFVVMPHQLRSQFAEGRTILGILGQRSSDDVGERFRTFRHEYGQRPRRLARVALPLQGRVQMWKRRLSRNRMIKDTAERIDIAARIAGIGIGRGFRRSSNGLPWPGMTDHVAGVGDCGVADRRAHR